jgi:hypothetical protein
MSSNKEWKLRRIIKSTPILFFRKFFLRFFSGLYCESKGQIFEALIKKDIAREIYNYFISMQRLYYLLCSKRFRVKPTKKHLTKLKKWPKSFFGKKKA